MRFVLIMVCACRGERCESPLRTLKQDQCDLSTLLLKAPVKRRLPMFGVISPLPEFAVKLLYMLSNSLSDISENDSNLSSR